MTTPPQPGAGFRPGSRTRSRSRRSLLLLGGTLTAGAVAAVAYRRQTRDGATGSGSDNDRRALGWGEATGRPDRRVIRTRDGAQLAVWELEGDGPDAPTVVLPHCWGCSHEIWIPVARRLREQGHRIVLYDQRGHGASTRGTAPLAVDTLAHDLEAVLEAIDARDVVLAGHSMGGMTIMSLATHRPEVLKERAKATVLVATAATSVGDRSPQAAQLAGAMIASRLVTRAMRARNGHLFVRSVFGDDPVRAHLDLTRELFAGCHGAVRGNFLVALATMNLLDGIATMDVPTTVMVGSRDTLTLPKKADQIASTVPGARLVTLEGRGHMLPLEDPDAVSDEIVRAVKG
jgi:non-heme chloroperoxidase